jgi:hypothetical protein
VIVETRVEERRGELSPGDPQLQAEYNGETNRDRNPTREGIPLVLTTS